jgi:hypothetical protein
MPNFKLYKPAKAGYLVLVDATFSSAPANRTVSAHIEKDVAHVPWSLYMKERLDVEGRKNSPTREFIKSNLVVRYLEPLSEPYTTKAKANAIFRFLSSLEGEKWLFRRQLIPKSLRIQEVQFNSTVATYRSGTIRRG